MFAHSLTGYVIAVLVVWLVILVVSYFVRGPEIALSMFRVFGGFVLGMIAMYIATRVYTRP
jgi:small neutral amino acid transporter SnatA (MarC family)